MDKDNRDDFTFAKLCDIKLPVTLRISQLEGLRKPRSFTEILDNPELKFHGVQSSSLSDLYVTCQLIADNKPLTIPFRTSFKAFKNSYSWNEWITLPIRYCDLPLSSQITFTVWDTGGPRTAIPVGGSTLRLFGKKWTLRRGKHRLLLWPGVEADGGVDTTTPSKMEVQDEMGRLEKLVKKYERGDLPKSDWLDKLTFRKMEEIHAAETEKSENLFIYIDLPRFDFPVIFSEPETSNQPITAATHTNTAPQQPATTNLLPNLTHDLSLWSVIDPDIVHDNPVEDKHRRLVRSHRSSPYDRELKPNAKIRDELGVILNYSPSQQLTSEEKDLIWKFRFYLARDKRGLTKFLKAVTWRDSFEVKQAVEELLPMWTEIDTDDALELLGPNTVDSRVRAFAVKQLSRADDDFESAASDQRSSRSATNAISYEDSGLTDFLIARGVQNLILGNRLYWYLMVEVALEDKVMAKMYGRVVFKFMNKILESEGGSERRELMRRQGLLVETLGKRARELRTSKDPRPKKIERLRSLLADSRNNMSSMSLLPLPLNARIEITGIIPEKSSVFKSNLYPLLLYFQCSDGSEYPVIFKDGDDMRQDQLVIQLITLMDRLLRKENLDLKLSPYDVLATGPLQGMAQFIPSKTIAAIVSEHGNLLNYLRVHNPDEGSVGTSGVEPSVIDTFVRSCAGYCVVTYILGVGDRHLDNLLLAPDGHFFHVDFGYILGRDPKPFPPPVKVCKEMVDGMGGAQSPHYSRFKNFCFTAFTILRKSANLILNLVALMVDANIPDIKHRDVHEQIQEKFRLDLTEEDAIKHFEALLNETSYLTVVLDRIHDLAQYWRS
ncbi:atypical/PIKK/PI3K protein kinase [Macrolepiota fuliginosa MF-IS2]|uniref:Phosphatidylinositol 3-kinase VPS34 n=1 Tax=Macrolepiota fuliginosa MF-IS2 TaxID=1400762 RepID=A0A9P6C907_9AGAR|nr:atypical/PIKK/PI3K protein kinase [Macrolepiota fuliginosa MF-IS2]